MEIPKGLPQVFPSVVHMLADAAAQAPGAPALICEDECLSYGQYLRCVAGFAHELRALGASGQRVAIVVGNSLDIAIANFAIHAAGAQLVPLNPIYTMRELEALLADAAPLVVVGDDSLEDPLRDLTRRLGIKHLIPVGTGTGRRLTAWRDDASLSLPTPLPSPDDLATLQYTGGTTGRSKGANLLHGRVALNVSQREFLLPTDKDRERVLCIAPMFHVYAVAMALHLAVYCRGALIVQRAFKPDQVFSVIEREKPTIIVGAPPVYIGLMAHESFSRCDLSSLRVCYSGASALPEEILRRWQTATGCPILEGFGQSESGPVLSFNPQNGLTKPQSVGIPTPGTKIQIVDLKDPDKVLGPGELGELRVSGPQLMIGYRNMPEETAAVLRDGWLYTGDIGEIDADGYLFIRDRKKDMVNVGGYNVYPREIEEVLYQHPAVREAAVVGVADAFRGEVAHAHVVVHDGKTVTAQALADFCAERLAKYKVPAAFRVVPALPKTTVGKIDKRTLRGEEK